LTNRTRYGLVSVGIGALIASLLATSGGASASHSKPKLVRVPQGAATQALTSGKQLGATAPGKRLKVSFVLRARHLDELQSRAQRGWSGAYLSTSAFAAQYGQTPAYVAALETYLHHYGITTHAYADRLDVSARGTAAQFDKALSVSLSNYRVTSTPSTAHGRTHRVTVYGTRTDPRIGADLAKGILAILGLSNYSSARSTAVRAVVHHPAVRAKRKASLPPGQLSPNFFVRRYHLKQVRAAGSRGQGQTLGIISLAAFRPSVPLTFWNKYLGLHEPASRLQVVNIDGGAPGPSARAGTDETDLDVEQSGAIAPRATVRVYNAPNTDPGFADAFFAAASDNVADTVSVSWGESETFVKQQVASGLEPPAFERVFDEAFLEYAAQGQSSFASSGDFGAYEAVGDLGTTNLSTQIPSDSPYITTAGGTTLPGVQTAPVVDKAGKPTGRTDSAKIPAERSWSWDYLWPLYRAIGFGSEKAAALALPIGGGGGYSIGEARPSYQRGLSRFHARRYLISKAYTLVAPHLRLPTQFGFDPTPALTRGSRTTGRAVPDVSTNADPDTGYAVYDPVLFPGGFAQYGGTSFVAPQLNAAAAVINSPLGHRTGFWNPQVYRFAHSGTSPFRPLNDTRVYSGRRYLYTTGPHGKVTALPGEFSNNNLYYTGTPGARWNPASGLGIPNLTVLAHAFRR
jgi:kumamolisin